MACCDRARAEPCIRAAIKGGFFGAALWGAAVLLLAGFLSLGSAAAATPAAHQFPRSRLTVVTASGRHVFDVEVAATPESRERGLMFRRHLGLHEGMLFDLGPGQHHVIMWMKDTLIPLDMIFIAGNGTVRSVAANTVPLSHKLIPSQGRVRAVLEVAAGTARRIGIGAGDKVLCKILK